jgi:hypothetical protein
MELDQILYVEGDEFCSPFAKLKKGDEAKVTLELVLASAGEVPNFEATDDGPKAKQKPFMQFVIKSVANRAGKVVAEQDEEEIEEQIAKVKGFGEGFDEEDLERQIMEAKMGKGAEDEEIVHTKDLEPAPASLLDMDDDDMAELEDDISEIKGFERKRKRRK